MPRQTRSTSAPHAVAPPQPWLPTGKRRLHTLAAALALCAGLAQHGAAQAVTLGRVEVLSAVGEPLRAEIELPQITPEELASLRVGLASADIYRAAGMSMNPALNDLQIRVERRAQGGAVLVLSTTSRLPEPFVELIVEAQWAAGRVLRDYSLALDSTRAGDSAPVTPLLPGTSPAPGPTDAAAAEPGRAPVPLASPLADPAPGMSQAAAAPDASPSAKIRVQPGDTASRIANVHRPATLSLDQMLVAMLRGNPAAFVNGNVNRMKAGTFIDMPSSAEAQAIAPEEARQIIAVQSRDFNEFRRRLAGGAPPAAPVTQERMASGQVQGEVKEARATDAPVDRLMLSKGEVAARDAEEDSIAQQRQAQQTAAQLAELSRNIEELARLSAAAPGSAAAPSPADAGSAQAPAPAVPPGGPALATTLPANAPAAQSSLVAALSKEPLAMPVAGGLLAMLAAVGFLVSRRRRLPRRGHLDSSLLPSPQGPGAHLTPGQAAPIPGDPAATERATADMPPSVHDVDPLTEADVYLAYGRDMQAEEILREALPGSTQRLAILQKLLEIHAHRRDTEGFEALALDARELTQGQGPQWARICEMGLALDATHPLYQPGAPVAAPSDAPGATTELDLDLDAGATQHAAGSATDTVDFDFDFPPEMAARIAASADPRTRASAQHYASGEEPSADSEDDEPHTPARVFEAPGAPARPPGVDWHALNLDLDLPAEEAAPSTPDGEDSPLGQQLSRARALRAQGDVDGARTLAAEVAARASGALRDQALGFLAALA